MRERVLLLLLLLSVCLLTPLLSPPPKQTIALDFLSLSIHPHSPFLSLFPSFILFSITAHDQSGKLEVVGLVVVIICRQNWKETSAKPQCWWIAAATKTTTTDTITVAAAAELVTVWSLAAVTKNPELRLRALTSGFSLSSTQSSEGRGRRNEDWGTDWRGKKKGLGLLIHTNASGGSGGDGENGEKKEETNCHCHQLKKRERKGEREQFNCNYRVHLFTHKVRKSSSVCVCVSWGGDKSASKVLSSKLEGEWVWTQ